MNKLQTLLYKSLDDTLTEPEQKELQAGLKSSELLRNEREDLLAMRKQLSTFEPSFSSGFSYRIMKEINMELFLKKRGKTGFYKTFKQVVLSGVAAIILILLTIYFTDGNLTYDTLAGVSNYSPETELLSFF